MVESICRMNHVVKAYECNWKGELSLSHVVGIMMLASRKQERSLAHPDLIYQKGLSWIVIQNQLTVNRLPKLEEEIISRQNQLDITSSLRSVVIRFCL